MIEANKETRSIIAKHLVEQQGITFFQALVRVNDVCEREKESPHFREVVEAVGAALRPIIDMIAAVNASGDPHSEESVAAVAVVAGDVLHVGGETG